MTNSPKRLLNTFELTEDFLTNELKFQITEANYHTITDIVGIELSLYNFKEEFVTKNSTAFRNLFYRSNEQRLELKKQIVQELIEIPNIFSDDEIELGKGGAAPEYVKNEHNAYILIGLPASGKSTVTNRVSKDYGAIVLDSDYAKRKLPEYKSVTFGASLVHEESDEIIFGNNKSEGFDYSLFDIATGNGANIVIPKIGKSSEGILILSTILNKLDYNVHLTLVKLDKTKATLRALNRFQDTQKGGRYLPLVYVYDDCNDNPTMTYNTLKKENSNIFSTFGVISTDVPFNSNFIVEEHSDNNPTSLF